MDDLMMRDQGSEAERATRANARLDDHAAIRSTLLIDGDPVDAEAVELDQRTYVSAILPDHTLVTIALPSDMIEAGFSTAIPGDSA
jgi:hypothetical protein